MSNLAGDEIGGDEMDDLAEDIVDFIEDHPGLRHQLQNQALNIKGFNIRVIRKLIEELRD